MDRVHWSLTAEADLESIFRYIARDSPFYAVRFVERIVHHTKSLADLPERGRIVPEFERNDLRELVFHSYRIIYRLEKGRIYVVSVTHGSMDLVSKARRESWEID